MDETDTDLHQAVLELRAETVNLRTTVARHTHALRRRLRTLAVLLVLFAAAGLVGAGAVVADVRQQRQAAADHRRACQLVTVLGALPGDEVLSSRDKAIAAEARKLAEQIGC